MRIGKIIVTEIMTRYESVVSDDDYWSLEKGDLLIIDDNGEYYIVEFYEHLFDGGFFYRDIAGREVLKTCARDEIKTKIVKGEY